MLTATDSRKAFRVQTYVVTLMVAFSVMSYFDRTIMSIAGPVIMHDLSLSATSMGAVYTAFLMSYAVMNLPGGHLADRFGPRLVLTVMGLGAALFTGLTALGGNPGLGAYLGVVPSFFLVRLAMGSSRVRCIPRAPKPMLTGSRKASEPEFGASLLPAQGLGEPLRPFCFPG